MLNALKPLPTIFLVLLLLFLKALPVVADDLGNLEKAFTLAFANPRAFEKTRLFEVLGYSQAQIKQMVEVTPRPASLSIEYLGVPGPDGMFDKIKVKASKVKYYNMTIDHAVFEFPRVRLDMKKLASGVLEFRNAVQIGIETYVSEADILGVFDLFAKARNLSHLRMEISHRQAVLKGRSRRGLLLIAFEVFGSPRLEGTKIIQFDCKKMVLNGLSLPQAAINALFKQINPVFDARKTWLKLDLQEILLEKGFIHSLGKILAAGGTGG